MSNFAFDGSTVHKSCDVIEESFIEDCRGLRLTVHQAICGNDHPLVTQSMTGPEAFATLEILRDEGYNVALSSLIFYTDLWAVVLVP